MDIDIVEKKYTIFLLIVLIYFIKTFFLIFFSWWRHKFNYEIRTNIGKRLFLKYMFESHKYHLSKNSSEFIRNITIDNMNFAFSTFQALYLITEVGILILLSAVLFYLQPAVTLFFCLTYLLFSIGWHIAFKKKLIKWGEDRQFYDGKMIQFLKEGFGGHKEIQILGVENYFIKKFKLNLFNAARMNFITDFVLDLPRLWLEFLLVMSFCFILMFLLIFKEFNFLAIAPLLAAYSAAGLRLIPSISRIIGAINIINFHKPVTKLFRQEFKDNINKNELKNESTKNLEFENTISLKNVSFSHLENLPEIIKNFNYEIKKKEIVGIVGLSGAGK
jgi:ABC-type bacteriocin/lantibiotic exporter with double-glycine peptidase domain